MKYSIISILHEKITFLFKTIAYGFLAAATIGPFLATITYYPEISIPFAFGMLTGVFCNQHRRKSIVEAAKKGFSYIVHDLGLAA
jgi:hypothetical protein